MIKMQQLEELEDKVVKALRLIDELRSENVKLEDENETLRGTIEETKLAVEEREQEVAQVKKELSAANDELKEVRTNEDALEQKMIMLLSKLETMPKQSDSDSDEKPKSSNKSDKSKAASTKKATKKKSESDNLKEDEAENANSHFGEIILEDDGQGMDVSIPDDEDFMVIEDK